MFCYIFNQADEVTFKLKICSQLIRQAKFQDDWMAEQSRRWRQVNCAIHLSATPLIVQQPRLPGRSKAPGQSKERRTEHICNPAMFQEHGKKDPPLSFKEVAGNVHGLFLPAHSLLDSWDQNKTSPVQAKTESRTKQIQNTAGERKTAWFFVNSLPGSPTEIHHTLQTI